MRDTSLLIATLGVILACVVCPSHSREFGKSVKNEPVRMASDSMVVRRYRNSESTTGSSKPGNNETFEEFQIYQGVMGKPGVDFPTYANIPATSFSCRGVKKSGYYADLATDCQVFHVCDGNRKISFLCPNGTIFRQSHLICDWWFRVDCGKSVELYDESAEQLEADQKIYKARAEERERRRKLAKALVAENGGEVTSSEVAGLDDTFKTNSPIKSVENTNFYAGTTKYPSFKSDRHSNKNSFGNSGEAFSNQYGGKRNEKVTESKEVNLFDNHSRVTFSNNKQSTVLGSTQKSGVPQRINQPPQNSFDSSIFKENIQGAESGSLVEDLANRNRNRNLNSNENKEINEFKSRKNSEYEGQKTTYTGKVSNNRDKNNFKNDERFDLLNEGRQAIVSPTERLSSNNNFYNQQDLGFNKTTFRTERLNSNKFNNQQDLGFNKATFSTTERLNSNNFYNQQDSGFNKVTFRTERPNSNSFYNQQDLGFNKATSSTTEKLNSNNFNNQQDLNFNTGRKENVVYNTHQTYQNSNQNSDGKDKYKNVNFPYSNADSSGRNTNVGKESNSKNNAYSNDQAINQQYNNNTAGQISETTVSRGNFEVSPTLHTLTNSYTNSPTFNDYTIATTTNYDNGVKSTTFEYTKSQSPQSFEQNLKNQNNFPLFTSNTEAEKISVTVGEENPVNFTINTDLTTFQNLESAKPTASNNFFEIGNTPQNSRESLKTETTAYDGNINFNYNNNRDNLKFDYNGGKNTDSLTDSKENTERVSPTYISPTYTTENLNYDGKRTSTFARQETIVPTTQNRKSHSSRYRTSTFSYGEQQSVDYSPSFESHRKGKSYSEFKDHSQTQNDFFKTTFRSPTTTDYFSTKAPSPEEEYSTVTELFKTTYHWPAKKNSKKVTFRPGTEAQSLYPTTKWQTTTFSPYYETTTANSFTSDEIYFTTATPDKEVEFIDEYGAFQDKTTRFESDVSTAKADVDITLRELDIAKTTIPAIEKNKTYEDYIREGLEVPPSLGPNAIRSFALYFGISNNTTNIPTTTYDPVTSHNNVLKQVDDLVHSNIVNKTEAKIDSREDLLPNSLLTQHTKDSYSALFSNSAPGNLTTVTELEQKEETSTPSNVGTTDFGSFIEEPLKINTELRKNDLDGSQSRGLVEPDPYSEDGSTKTPPDLRELAQVFTKALSAYLDDPEAFRKVLSEIRPTEPSLDADRNGGTVQYPSAVKEDGEVLDFSDVTKSLYKKKTESTTPNHKVTTTLITEASTTPTKIPNEIENLILPYNSSNNTNWATNIELTAPLLESLDQSQSSYYTPPPSIIGTTNAIAEEINQFIEKDKSSLSVSNEVVDSYFPVSTESPLSKYGGFQNNSRGTAKYSPYGSELTFSTSSSSSSGASPFTINTAIDSSETTETLPANSTSFYENFSKNRTEEEEIQLAKELNNLILLPKFTTPRPTTPEFTTSVPHLSTFHAAKNEINQYRDINLGNGEILETNILSRAGKALKISDAKDNSYFNPAVEEINSGLSPQSTTPKGFLITYSIQPSSDGQPATYLPKETTPTVVPTTYSPGQKIYFATTTDPFITTAFRSTEDATGKINDQTLTGDDATTGQTITQSFAGSTKSFDRITELQETLMFNTKSPTNQQKYQARESVQEMMGNLNMTESTAHTLMKVMEMAAKNDTYRRLVLLLVNDKSGRNKTVEETRLSLLRALLTPVISVQNARTIVPIPDPLQLAPANPLRTDNIRRSKSIRQETSKNKITTLATLPTTLPPTTVTRPKNVRRKKTSKNQVESNYRKSELGNLGTIKRTIENSRSKQVKLNSIDDAILNSDSRAVELLRSLYSLAARWG